MGLKIKKKKKKKSNDKKVIKPKQTMTPLQNTKINSSTFSNTTIKIPKMNLFKTTTTISEPNSLPNEDKKKRIIIIYLINTFFSIKK